MMLCWKKMRVLFVLLLTAVSLIYLLSSLTKQSSSKLKQSLLTKNLLVFRESKRLPYFSKPVLSHPNDIFRERQAIVANSFSKRNLTKSKLILFYKVPSWLEKYYMPYCSLGIQSCPVSSCKCSDNRQYFSEADAVIIDGVELSKEEPPVKYPHQVWIFYGLEPPTEYLDFRSLRSGNWKSMFNWTMTYRLDSDVVAPYDVLIRNTIPSKKNFTEVALGKSKSALWVVSHCETPSKRKKYIKKLNESYPVDIYGACGPPQARINETDVNVLYKDYRFYLAFENALCDDYVTEKFFKVFSRDVDVIPVVRGRAAYHSFFPKGTFINTDDFPSPKTLADYLNYLERNVTAYTELLSIKDRYTKTGDFGKLSSPFCDVCIKLHNLDKFRSHYVDVSKWLEEGTCIPPNDY